MIALKKINDEVVRPVRWGGDDDPRPIKGSNLFNTIKGNIFICAKKASGKSTVIVDIVKKKANKYTTVVVFASTLYLDKNYKYLMNYCEKKNIPFMGYTSIRDGKVKKDNIDLVDELLGDVKTEAKDEYVKSKKQNKKKDENPRKKILLLDSEDEEEKPKKSKYQTPRFIVIFDDLSHELKAPSITKFVKESRHYGCLAIISSQYLLDILPEARKQLDYVLLFRGLNEDKLDVIYKNVDIKAEYEEFKQMYEYATKENYSFFYIDVRNDVYRRNFNYQFKLKDI